MIRGLIFTLLEILQIYKISNGFSQSLSLRGAAASLPRACRGETISRPPVFGRLLLAQRAIAMTMACQNPLSVLISEC